MRNFSKVIFVLLMTFVLALSASAWGFEASETIVWDGHIYERFDESLTWDEAKKFCEERGGHLVTIASVAEEKIVEDLIEKGGKLQYWIGMKNDEISGFSWVTGEDVTYTNWDANQPDSCVRNGDRERYVHMLNSPNPAVSGSCRFGWNDMFKNNQFPDEEYFFNFFNVGFICERVSEEYDYNGNTYKFFDLGQGSTWEQAVEYCESIGGHIATITSKAENDFVYALLRENGYESAYFGLTDKRKEGTWENYDGTPATYLNWADGEPNNSLGAENYGMFYYQFPDGRWNDGDFGKTTVGNDTMFICEWEGSKKEIDKNKFVKPEQIKSVFYADSSWFVGSGIFKYDDNFLSGTSYKYNHDFARLAIRYAFSAFRKTGKNLENQSKNAKKMLESMRYFDIDCNDFFKNKPDTNSIGVIAGTKKVAFEDGDYTIIAVAVSGGNYESEWGGNFNVGSSGNHKGFEMARDEVLRFLKWYVGEYDIKGDVKLWITGYSRAAATSNLTAAYLDKNPDYLGNGIVLNSENIYAYCFETPMGTTDEDRNSELYGNIFSIVNQNDFVPMVAPEKWGFGRYGVTYFLPSSLTHSKKNYNALVESVYEKYNSYVPEEHRTTVTESIDEFSKYELEWFGLVDTHKNESIGLFYEKLVSKLLVVIGSRQDYVKKEQEAMVQLMAGLLGSGSLDTMIEAAAKEYMRCISLYGSLQNLYETVTEGESLFIHKRVIKAAFESVGSTIDDKTLDYAALLLGDIVVSGDILYLFGNAHLLPDVHFPELCMSWLDAVNYSQYLRKTRFVCVNCPVDVEVFDADGNFVAGIYNDEVSDNDKGVCAYVDSDGQKIIYLPVYNEYSIKVYAREDGEMTYFVRETDLETGSVNITNYADISICAGDEFLGSAERSLEESVEYSLEMNGDALSCDYIEDAEAYLVTADCQGVGSVTGGGMYYQGEFANVKANVCEGEEFLGWYDGDKRVSKDEEYRFEVKGDAKLVAKFTSDTVGVVCVDEDGILYSRRVVMGESVGEIEAPEIENRRFIGWYMDEALTEEFSPELKATSDMTIYSKWEYFDRIVLTIGERKAIVFGNTVVNDVAPMIKNSRTMLPIRFVAEALEAGVDWVADERKVVIYKDSTEIEIFIDSDVAFVNGREVALDSPAFIMDGRTFLPLRFVSQNLGAKVVWNGEDRSVTIIKK